MAQFPYQLVTRGEKRVKTTMGDLTLSEYLWAFIQMIKSKGQSDPDVPFMNMHLERIIEDTKKYEWGSVRMWSEEICTRVADGRVAWSNTYEIDRLQGELAHKTLLATAKTGAKEGGGYELSEELRKAKPAPPCKAYQHGSCTSDGDHVQNGYRHIHVCSHCFTNKCSFIPHPFKECKSKSYFTHKKSAQESGFDNPQTNK